MLTLPHLHSRTLASGCLDRCAVPRDLHVGPCLPTQSLRHFRSSLSNCFGVFRFPSPSLSSVHSRRIPQASPSRETHSFAHSESAADGVRPLSCGYVPRRVIHGFLSRAPILRYRRSPPICIPTSTFLLRPTTTNSRTTYELFLSSLLDSTCLHPFPP